MLHRRPHHAYGFGGIILRLLALSLAPALALYLAFLPTLARAQAIELLTPRPVTTCTDPGGATIPCLAGVVSFADASYNGRVVLFTSVDSRLVPDDTNRSVDVFVAEGGQVRRVNTSARGVEADHTSDVATLSGNGRYVYFRSRAGNLVEGTVREKFNLYLKDLHTGQLALISRDAEGKPQNLIVQANFLHLDTTFDGRYLVYAADFAASSTGITDANTLNDVFLLDLDPDDNGNLFDQTPRYYLLSINAAATATGNNSSFAPSISEHGRYIAFITRATDIHPFLDSNGSLPDVVLLSLGQLAGSLDLSDRTLVPINTAGDDATTMTARGVIVAQVAPWQDSIAFVTADNIPDTDDSNDSATTSDLYVSWGAGMGQSFTNRQLIWVSRANGPGGPQSNASNAIETIAVAADAPMAAPAVGGMVAWLGEQSNMENGDDNNVADLFIRRDSAVYPTNWPVPNWPAAATPSHTPVSSGGLSGQGRYVFWATQENYELAAKDTSNLYRRRIAPLGSYTLTVTAAHGSITRTPPGLPVTGGYLYRETTPVTLTVTPHPGYRFTGWQGTDARAITGTTTATTAHLYIDDPRSVTATFAALTPPLAASLVLTTPEDTPLFNIPLVINDPDPNEQHTLALMLLPRHGTTTISIINGTQVHYTPTLNFNGSDAFAVSITDAYGLQSPTPVTITIQVEPRNDPPYSAFAFGSGANHGTPIALLVTIGEYDLGDSHTLAILTQPQQGRVSLSEDGSYFLYTPNAGFVGNDSFTFTATDRAGENITGTATVTVNDPSAGPLYLPALAR